MNITIKTTFFVLALITLAGCGGGSGDSEPSAEPTPPPEENTEQGGNNTAVIEKSLRLNDAQVGVQYTQKIAFQLPGAVYQYEVESLPSWATFNEATKVLSGTPQAASKEQVVINVSADDNRWRFSGYLQVQAAQPVNTETLNLAGAMTNEPYSYQLTLDLPEGQYTYSAEQLPDWLSFDSQTLTLSGTATSNELAQFVIVAEGTQATWRFESTLPVRTLIAKPMAFASGLIGATYEQQLTFDLPQSDYTFSAETLPNWLSFSEQTHTLKGVPRNEGLYNVVIDAIDHAHIWRLSGVIPIQPHGDNAATIITLANGIKNEPYSHLLDLALPAGNYDYQVTSKPQWLQFNTSEQRLSGTPTSAGVFVFALNAYQNEQTFSFKGVIQVTEAQSVALTLPSASVGADYEHTISASLPEGDYTYTAKTLPSWASFDPASLRLSGVVSNSSSQDVVIYASNGLQAWRLYGEVDVSGTTTVLNKPLALPMADEGQAYSHTVDFQLPSAQYSYELEQAPGWLNFNAQTQVLSGVPLSAGNSPVAIRVTGDGKVYLYRGELQVKAKADTINKPLNLPSGIRTAAYYAQVNYALPSGDYSYEVLNIPSWLSYDPQHHTVTGKPTHPGVFNIKVKVASDEQQWLFSGEIAIEDHNTYLSRDVIDFYARDYSYQPRQLRDDLSGELAAEIQFVQSHAVAPNNNYQRNSSDETLSRYMPSVVAQREALILFLPHDGKNIDGVSAKIALDGQAVLDLDLNHPNTLPRADFQGGDGVAYSTNAWWAILPWQHVRNGLSIEFSSGQASGTLSADSIDIADASHMVFKSIRLGMLTYYDESNGHWTLRDPVSAATDYFQTLPISSLVLASYDGQELDKVIIRDGTIYDKERDVSSAVEGGIYSGDMRGDVAKSQVSVGINMADYGYTSNSMNQRYSHVFKQITNHHAWGQYTNGRIKHGLSGGNGIGTLVSSWGNEASHEWGHAYGLGHYPGQGLTTDGRWAVHHSDSGWGWIAHRKRMRANITAINSDNTFGFHKDAMSGGWENSPFSVYTYYTGFTARIIQNNVAGFPVPDASYESGYKKWDTDSGAYTQHISSHPAPVKVGVPVATILGGYDPDGNNALIYPVFHGNYGNIYDLPAPDLSASDDQCWVSVSNAAGEQRQIKVSATRHASNSINQLHFNLEAQFKPTQAVLTCRRDGTDVELTRTQFNGLIPELPVVAQVGQEHGFKQLKDRDFEEIEAELQALSEDASFLPASVAYKVASYELTELLPNLSESSRAKLTRIHNLEAAVQGLRALIAHAQAQGLDAPTFKQRVLTHLLAEGLSDSSDLTLSGSEVQGNNYFFSHDGNAGSNVQLVARTDDNQGQRTQWVFDDLGRLHPVATPWLCAEQVGSGVNLTSCSTSNTAQQWLFNATNPWVIKNASTSKCLDFDRTNIKLIPYGCHGGWNQKWYNLSFNSELWLSLLNANELKVLHELLLN
ncbi:hypothetical protein EXT46_06955 [Pseudoalteromonas sp. CO325X]|uniref:putative Ig domain-containing protein n=1 Tax=Pseudoalteromonas sp. CO325X TaxID=1777262 RepID=UPI001022DC08|nr:putative Ig domain-containing protein [Pseudoalteromonas sp. CO325X]RZF83180.1 hypothetical protein EXT46_06955 [Pseudoalteromonas sp. CO325X]